MSENIKKIFKALEIIYVSMLTAGYLWNIKKLIKDMNEGGIGKLYTILLGMGIVIIYYRLFIVKKQFRWFEYTMIVLNIFTMLINYYFGLIISVANYALLLFLLYFGYYPSIRHKVKLNKWDKLMYVFMSGLILLSSIYAILMIIFND